MQIPSGIGCRLWFSDDRGNSIDGFCMRSSLFFPFSCAVGSLSSCRDAHNHVGVIHEEGKDSACGRNRRLLGVSGSATTTNFFALLSLVQVFLWLRRSSTSPHQSLPRRCKNVGKGSGAVPPIVCRLWISDDGLLQGATLEPSSPTDSRRRVYSRRSTNKSPFLTVPPDTRLARCKFGKCLGSPLELSLVSDSRDAEYFREQVEDTPFSCAPGKMWQSADSKVVGFNKIPMQQTQHALNATAVFLNDVLFPGQ